MVSLLQIYTDQSQIKLLFIKGTPNEYPHEISLYIISHYVNYTGMLSRTNYGWLTCSDNLTKTTAGVQTEMNSYLVLRYFFWLKQHNALISKQIIVLKYVVGPTYKLSLILGYNCTETIITRLLQNYGHQAYIYISIQCFSKVTIIMIMSHCMNLCEHDNYKFRPFSSNILFQSHKATTCIMQPHA